MPFQSPVASPRTPNQIHINVGHWGNVKSTRMLRNIHVRLGLYHTTKGVRGERQAKRWGGYPKGFAGGKSRGVTTKHCEKRCPGLYRHVRHHIKKDFKGLLQGERGQCFVVVRRVGDVDQLVNHDRMWQGVTRRESVSPKRRGGRARYLSNHVRGPQSYDHTNPKSGRSHGCPQFCCFSTRRPSLVNGNRRGIGRRKKRKDPPHL